MIKKAVGYGCMFLMVFLSLSLIGADKLKNTAIKDTSRQLSINNFTIDEIQRNTSEANIHMQEEVEIPGIRAVMEGLAQIDRKDIIGGILIPDVNINLPIFQGVTRNNLMGGAGTLTKEQHLGQGNYGLAGHHMRDNSLLFGPLLDIQLGAYIYVTDLERLYTYKVDLIELVHEEQTEVLDETDEPIITLITCNISGVNTNNRHIVQGILIDDVKLNENSSEKTDNIFIRDYFEFIDSANAQNSYSIIVWLLAISLIAALVTGLGYYIINR